MRLLEDHQAFQINFEGGLTLTNILILIGAIVVVSLFCLAFCCCAMRCCLKDEPSGKQENDALPMGKIGQINPGQLQTKSQLPAKVTREMLF